MIPTRKAEYGKGLAAVAFLLFLTAFYLSSHKFGALMPLWVFGWVFFGCGGGATFRWRYIPALARVFVLIGSALMALAAVWPWVYKESWLIPLSGGVAAVASVLAILSGWIYLRATASRESQV